MIPHPLLSLTLALIWLLLNGFSINALLMASLIGVVLPHLTSIYWPDPPRLKRPLLLIPYVGLVLFDILIANLQVAWIILFVPAARLQSVWITVPINLPSPEAQTLLAGTITLTPGTLTAHIAPDGQSLLIHALHAPDPDALCSTIKSRYEARLQRIFA